MENELNEEQVVANEAKVIAEKEATEVKKQNKTEALRELSEELGINAFEPSELKKKFNEFTQWQESQKSEQEKLQEKYNLLDKEKSLFTEKEQGYQTKIEALSLGFSSKQLDEVLALAKVNIKEGETIIDGLKLVKEKYGSVFTTTTNIGIQHNDLQGDKLDIKKSEQEKYLANSPAVVLYKKQKERLTK